MLQQAHPHCLPESIQSPYRGRIDGVCHDKLRVHAVEACIATAPQWQHPAAKIQRSRAFHMTGGNHDGCHLVMQMTADSALAALKGVAILQPLFAAPRKQVSTSRAVSPRAAGSCRGTASPTNANLRRGTHYDAHPEQTKIILEAPAAATITATTAAIIAKATATASVMTTATATATAMYCY